MSQLTIEDVHRMAKAAGLELDDARAETIAARLSGVLQELEEISTDELMSVEPAQTFTPDKGAGVG